jgi:hypothetical protein
VAGPDIVWPGRQVNTDKVVLKEVEMEPEEGAEGTWNIFRIRYYLKQIFINQYINGSSLLFYP